MTEAPEDWEQRVKPFLEHAGYIVSIKGECRRFLQWLAHMAQHPEELPHTCYLMITQTTGIGRNLLASMVVRAFRGQRCRWRLTARITRRRIYRQIVA